MFSATVIMASIFGYKLFGLDGMCVGAAIGYFVGFVVTSKMSSDLRATVESCARNLNDLKTSIDEQTEKISAKLPASSNFYTAVLDGLPIRDYRLMEFYESRTHEEWKKVNDRIWPLLRRRLIDGYGLAAKSVDAARSELMDEQACERRWPRSDKDLEQLVAEWRKPMTDEDIRAAIRKQAEIMGLSAKS